MEVKVKLAKYPIRRLVVNEILRDGRRLRGKREKEMLDIGEERSDELNVSMLLILLSLRSSLTSSPNTI